MKKTVNFIEAVNSGKRFKPVDLDKNLYPCTFCSLEEYDKDWFNFEFINAQFKLEEKPIAITESEFERAWFETWGNVAFPFELTAIKKEMGF